MATSVRHALRAGQTRVAETRRRRYTTPFAPVQTPFCFRDGPNLAADHEQRSTITPAPGLPQPFGGAHCRNGQLCPGQDRHQPRPQGKPRLRFRVDRQTLGDPATAACRAAPGHERICAPCSETLPDNAGATAKDVDLILVATFTPDMSIPSTACLVQDRLKATCPSLEIQAACSGFVYALVTGAAYVISGASRMARDRRRLQHARGEPTRP